MGLGGVGLVEEEEELPGVLERVLEEQGDLPEAPEGVLVEEEVGVEQRRDQLPTRMHWIKNWTHSCKKDKLAMMTKLLRRD